MSLGDDMYQLTCCYSNSLTIFLRTYNNSGKRSSQFEHTLLVTETGYELLTGRENEPIMTWNDALNTR